MDRRTFLTGFGLAAAGTRVFQPLAAQQTGILPVYASVGAELTQYDWDVVSGAACSGLARSADRWRLTACSEVHSGVSIPASILLDEITDANETGRALRV
jgi:hypothetical protein